MVIINKGSRRFQRFVNSAFLIDQQQKFSSGLTTQDMEEDVTYPASLFHSLFENEEDLQAWQQFVDESEENQDIFLMEMEDKPKKCTNYKANLALNYLNTDFPKTSQLNLTNQAPIKERNHLAQVPWKTTKTKWTNPMKTTTS